ncbi:MAG: hypothetical protein KDD27_21420, partial [Saprospiraceae bacterium]|nr:hypothetical protein [Saprospiraceae bacterium]
MKITANHPLLVFSFLLIAFFGFGQTNKQAQTTFSLDLASLSQSLAGSPDFSEKSLHKAGAVIELPMPDGVRKSFRMFRTHPMHPDLAARYPEIQTYHGKCMEDGVSGVSVTISPTGLHAFLVDEKFQRVYIEPEGGADPARYVSFYEPADAMANYMCPYEHGEMQQETLHKHAPPKGTAPQNVAENMVNSPLAMGDKLRTYRLAMPCTGEFGLANGGTVASVLAVMAASVNAVNLIYIREMAIKFELVPNNDQVLYFDGNTDPYLNDGQIHDPPIVDDLETNNIVCNTVIGASNYDIGHLLQYPTSCPGCGGWAGAGPCIPSFKASGMSINEVGILIHEMGHQFWMPHTTDTGPPNRYDHIAIGNTIMGRNDALPGSSDYFHVSSTDLAATEVEDPGHCVPGVATNNTIPTVTVGTGGMYIPKSTPFQLSGSATDPDPNTTLVYNWQQYNNDTTYNVINHRLYPVGNAPIFRNFFPTTDGNVRTIPRLEDLVNDTIPFGFANCDNMGNNCDTLDLEGLPTYSRNLTFRLVARDFEPTGGAFDYATLSFEVDGNSGPFKVTAPNGGGTWTAGTNADITWDVANTDNAPVSCATVDIFLSLDGGYTYPITIATGTPNDGSYTYAVPGGYPPGTNMVRVKIACATYENVVFFDVSDSDFTISGPCMADAGIIVPGDTVTAVQGSP